MAIASAVIALGAPGPRLHFEVVFETERGLVANVRARAQTLEAAEAEQWTSGMPGAERFISGLSVRAEGDIVAASWSIDVGKMAAQTREVDLALGIAGGFVMQDGAILWRPARLPDDTKVTVEIRAPPGVDVAAPWARLRAGAFVLDGAILDGGGYLFVGKHRDLGVALPGQELHAVVAGDAFAARPATLKRWVERSAAMVADYNRGSLPVPRTHLILLPMPGVDEPGVFGSTMRWGHGSIALFFGARAKDASFDADWVAPHELLHLVNPHLSERLPWFIEGFTTYGQDLIRARAGAASVEAMWADIMAGVLETCGTNQGKSLLDASRTMHETHAYRRVYWGGACSMLIADVALRESTGNRRSLDDVMLALRQKSLHKRLGEDDVIGALIEATVPGTWGRDWLEASLRSKKALPVKTLYARLGLVRREGGAKLDDRAPLAFVSRGIMERRVQSGRGQPHSKDAGPP